MSGLSRRTFLVTGAGLVLSGPALLAACGSDDDSGGGGGVTVEDGSDDGTNASFNGPLVLTRYFLDGTQVAGAQRFAFGLADDDQLLGPEKAPAELTVRFMLDGQQVGDPVTVARHVKGLERAYYPVRAELAARAGVYQVLGDTAGQQPETSVTVAEPGAVALPTVGDRMIAVETPTDDDARGVDPICTREPPCELHKVTLTAALDLGKPVAFLVATPAFCEQATCGPVLDVLRTAGADFTDQITFVHAEVYTDTTIVTTTPAVQAYHLEFEPALFLADASGTIVDRLDVLFDEDEVRERLALLV